ncbi:hypothetical protein BDQ17DRAFT_1353044 [Cyathus striatus]|nr:hypothetical protein BDQ17DRAFT_1353044 [Cyathus striatus]
MASFVARRAVRSLHSLTQALCPVLPSLSYVRTIHDSTLGLGNPCAFSDGLPPAPIRRKKEKADVSAFTSKDKFSEAKFKLLLDRLPPALAHSLATKVAPERKTEDIPIVGAIEVESLPQSYSDLDFGTLHDYLNITYGGLLPRKGNHDDHIANTTSVEMYDDLKLLRNIGKKNGRECASMWIEAILFQTSTMISSSGKRMGFEVNKQLPTLQISLEETYSLKMNGICDYTALLMDSCRDELSITTSHFERLKKQGTNVLFITEAKHGNKMLCEHTPKAVAELYALGRFLKKNIVHGVLTNGSAWIFLILYLNESGVGGSFLHSPTIRIQLNRNHPHEVLHPEPDIITGILSYWMEHSFLDIDENDWFFLRESS